MPPSGILVLAALLFPAFAPCAAAGWDDYDARFRAESERVLEELTTAGTRIAFSKIAGIRLEIIAPQAPALSETSVGFYDGDKRRVLLNRKLLSAHADRLQREGVERTEIPIVLAWQMAPTLAHEMQHALSETELREETGLDFPVNSFEEELLAAFVGARAAAEAIRRRPLYFSKRLLPEFVADDVERAEALKAGARGFTALIRAKYPGHCSVVSWSRRRLLRWLRGEESRACARLKARTPAHACGPVGADAVAMMEAHGFLKGLEPGVSVEKTISFLRRSLAAIDSRRKFAALKIFYKVRLAAMSQALGEPRRYRSK